VPKLMLRSMAMKAKAGPMAPTTGTTIDGLQASIRKNAPSNLNFQQLPNNRRSRSQAYQSMNQLIVDLDSAFDLLPPLGGAGTPTQEGWEIEAANYGAIPVCGCKNQIIGGKKLFRLVNFMRSLEGLAIDSTPPSFTGWQNILFISVQCLNTSNPLITQINIQCTSASGDFYLIFQLGKGLANPVLVFNFATSPLILHAGDPGFDDLLAYKGGAIIACCIWDSLYRPVSNNAGSWQTFP
jgi:hypothetical protein